jgi:hypothetical protein
MADAFDTGVKYGRVGTGVGNLVKAGADVYVDNQNKAKIDELTKKYNDPMSMEFQGMSPSEKAGKLSRLLYPLDPQMSQRYEQIANTERVKEASQKREDTQNATIATAFEQPKTAYETAKAANMTAWKPIAKDIEGKKEELVRAKDDLVKLQAFADRISAGDKEGTQSFIDKSTLPFPVRNMNQFATKPSIEAPASININPSPALRYSMPDSNYMQKFGAR